MANDIETFEVPDEAQSDMKIVAEVLRDSLSKSLGKEVEAGLIEGDSRGLLVEAGTVLLYVSSAGLAIITKKWLEECVWPELKKRLENPTKATIDFLFELASPRSREAEDG